MKFLAPLFLLLPLSAFAIDCPQSGAGNQGDFCFKDSDSKDIQLTMKATCSNPEWCFDSVGVEHGYADTSYIGSMSFSKMQIVDNKNQARDITAKVIAAGCQTVVAPQAFHVVVDASGNATVSCLKVA